MDKPFQDILDEFVNERLDEIKIWQPYYISKTIESSDDVVEIIDAVGLMFFNKFKNQIHKCENIYDFYISPEIIFYDSNKDDCLWNIEHYPNPPMTESKRTALKTKLNSVECVEPDVYYIENALIGHAVLFDNTCKYCKYNTTRLKFTDDDDDREIEEYKKKFISSLQNIDNLTAEHLKLLYKAVSDAYARRFCEMYGFDFSDGWWVSDEAGSVFCTSDMEYSLSMTDIVLLVDNCIPYKTFKEWWDWNMYAHMAKEVNYRTHTFQEVNLKSWIMGYSPMSIIPKEHFDIIEDMYREHCKSTIIKEN